MIIFLKTHFNITIWPRGKQNADVSLFGPGINGAPLFLSRRSLPVAGGVAGPRQAQSDIGVPASLRVLPDSDDCELPGAELHCCTGGSAL